MTFIPFPVPLPFACTPLAACTTCWLCQSTFLCIRLTASLFTSSKPFSYCARSLHLTIVSYLPTNPFSHLYLECVLSGASGELPLVVALLPAAAWAKKLQLHRCFFYFFTFFDWITQILEAKLFCACIIVECATILYYKCHRMPGLCCVEGNAAKSNVKYCTSMLPRLCTIWQKKLPWLPLHGVALIQKCIDKGLCVYSFTETWLVALCNRVN